MSWRYGPDHASYPIFMAPTPVQIWRLPYFHPRLGFCSRRGVNKKANLVSQDYSRYFESCYNL